MKKILKIKKKKDTGLNTLRLTQFLLTCLFRK